MNEEFLKALREYMLATARVMSTFADATYINGTSNNQFQKMQAAEKELHAQIEIALKPKPPTPEPYS